MMSTKPMRKYATKVGNYAITVHAVTKIAAMTDFQRKGIIVAVPGIYEIENEFGIPLKKTGRHVAIHEKTKKN